MKRRVALAFGLLSSLAWVGLAAADEPKAAPAPAPSNTPAPIVIKDANASPMMIYGGGCDSCQPSCGGGGGLQAGIGFYYIKPHFETNPAYTVSREAQDGTLQIRQSDFDYDYEFAPIIWVGFSNCDGLGVRARYWWYDNNASTLLGNDGTVGIDSAAPLGLQNLSTTNGDVLLFATDLQIKVWDLEVTQAAKVWGWDLLLAGGLRYAHISQSYVHVELPTVGDTLVDAISSGHNFKGIGPTVAAELRRDLGIGLTLYGAARASILFGTGEQNSTQVVNNTPDTFVSTSRDDVMPITELEIGAEFSREMGGSRLFVQAALVSQVWYGAGNAANNEMIPLLVDPEVSDNSSNLGLFGFRIAVGVNY
jgi:hypothetical protein